MARDQALNEAVAAARARGAIVIVITHRPMALSQLDQVAILAEGQIKATGSRDDVLRAIIRQGGTPLIREPQATATGARG